MLYKVILSICMEAGGAINEGKYGGNVENVDGNCIDILLGFDDVVALGYRESVTVEEIGEGLRMESAEEKGFLARKKQQEEDAKEVVKRQLEKNVKGGGK